MDKVIVMITVLLMSMSVVFAFIMFLMMINMFRSLGSVSFSYSNSCFVDFLLGDGSISLVGPHSVGSEVLSSTVDPGLITNIGDSTTSIVITDSKGLPVSLILDCSDFFDLSRLLPHLVQGPSGTDIDDVLSFRHTFGIPVDHGAPLEGFSSPDTPSGQLVGGEDVVAVQRGATCFFYQEGSSILSLRGSKWVGIIFEKTDPLG